MKEKIRKHNNEIDLIDIFKTIWNERMQFFLITILSLTIIITYNSQQPKLKTQLFNNHLKIKSAKNSEFIKFLPIYDYLNDGKKEQQTDKLPQNLKKLEINNEIMLDKFVREIMDYEELIFVLKNNKNIKKKISKLSKKDQTQTLYNFAKLLTVKKSNEELNENLYHYTLNFIWEDEGANEGKEILDKAIKLSINNLEKAFFEELENLLYAKKHKMISANNSKIEYLLEQSLIAKELDLADIQIDSFNLSNQSVSLNITTNQFAYYLRGYKAIDKEISIIKNRNYKEISDFQKKINTLKNNNNKWIDYNIFLLNVKKLEKINSNILPLHLAILLSLAIGMIYVFIFKVLRSQKLITKN